LGAKIKGRKVALLALNPNRNEVRKKALPHLPTIKVMRGIIRKKKRSLNKRGNLEAGVDQFLQTGLSVIVGIQKVRNLTSMKKKTIKGQNRQIEINREVLVI